MNEWINEWMSNKLKLQTLVDLGILGFDTYPIANATYSWLLLRVAQNHQAIYLRVNPWLSYQYSYLQISRIKPLLQTNQNVVVTWQVMNIPLEALILTLFLALGIIHVQFFISL